MSIAKTTRRHALALFVGATGVAGFRSTTALGGTTPERKTLDVSERTLSQIVEQDITRTPFGYGARGDAKSDDGPALRQAVASYGPPGGAVDLPAAQYKSGATGGHVLLIDAPVALSGKGASLSIINPELARDIDDTIIVSPNLNFSHEGLVLRDFGLLNPTNGERRGRRGIVLKTDSPGQQLAGVWLENLSIGGGTGADAWGVHHQNGYGARLGPNANGGWYGGGIRRCLIKGGVFLENSGDSLHIDDNILSGARRSLTVSLISGASCLTVRGNNMTSIGGAIKHTSGHRCSYSDNNIEHDTAGIETDSDGHRAVVIFDGEKVSGVANRFIGGLISCFGSSDANVLIKIKNQRGFVLDKVTMLTGIRGVAAIYIAASSKDTIIGQLIGQDINGDCAIDLSIIDHGVGTMGITKTALLRNGWVADKANDEAFQYRKTTDGRVHLWGSISSNAVSKDTVVTILPPGFRPARICRLSVTAFNERTSKTSTGRITILLDGTVGITHVPNDIHTLDIDVSFEALNAGRALTAE